MGFRFQKRISILPGVRLNLSKSGASWSFGPRGASVNLGKRGVYGTVGVPGTGLSYRERLDKPSRRTVAPSRDPGPQLPDRVVVRLEANEARFYDGDERPLHPSLEPAARRQLKDDLKSFLKEHAEERNAALDQLRQLHHDIPTMIGIVQPSTSNKPQREHYASQGDYMEALMTWRAGVANAGPDQDAIEAALLQQLGALAWPAETNIAISLTGTRLLLDVDLPEIEDMPSTQWSALISKAALTEKPMNQKDVAGLYLDHVCSILVRLIGHAMAVSSGIETVAISAYTQRSTSSGRLDDEYVATAEVRRADWSMIDTAAMAAIDPHNLLRRLGARIETNARGALLVQNALT
ncbi:DUF4236 domain-containing protein [Sphingomonas sp. VNH70]|jgi:hypothetical protein|uniref:DUF4236 domain-containing protein n=1 Tax=Sphingomonas silueang TaxID=3156617 RepID=UPI0032B5BA6B